MLQELFLPIRSAFISCRSIVYPIIITSECLNLLDHKCEHGNVAVKFDIRKVFDTLDWDFLLQVLASFGFDPVFINYINNILKSAYLSISLNGRTCGYFACSRGVRQGDPLSPLLFCHAEEVLSDGLSLLVEQNVINRIASSRNILPPSHVLFADDVMVFLQGSSSNIHSLMLSLSCSWVSTFSRGSIVSNVYWELAWALSLSLILVCQFFVVALNPTFSCLLLIKFRVS